MKYYVKIWVESVEDFIDWEEFNIIEDAERECNILKSNGERAIIERFAESSRDSELTNEVNWYNDTFNR